VKFSRPGKHLISYAVVFVSVSFLACSAPWLSGVLSELKPGFLQIVFSRIRRRVHDKYDFGMIFYSSRRGKDAVCKVASTLERNDFRRVSWRTQWEQDRGGKRKSAKFSSDNFCLTAAKDFLFCPKKAFLTFHQFSTIFLCELRFSPLTATRNVRVVGKVLCPLLVGCPFACSPTDPCYTVSLTKMTNYNAYHRIRLRSVTIWQFWLMLCRKIFPS